MSKYKTNSVRLQQEKYVKESLTRAMKEVREAQRTGKQLLSVDDLLKEMENW